MTHSTQSHAKLQRLVQFFVPLLECCVNAVYNVSKSMQKASKITHIVFNKHHWLCCTQPAVISKKDDYCSVEWFIMPTLKKNIGSRVE